MLRIRLSKFQAKLKVPSSKHKAQSSKYKVLSTKLKIPPQIHSRIQMPHLCLVTIKHTSLTLEIVADPELSGLAPARMRYFGIYV
jgi:hypothetical protein